MVALEIRCFPSLVFAAFCFTLFYCCKLPFRQSSASGVNLFFSGHFWAFPCACSHSFAPYMQLLCFSWQSLQPGGGRGQDLQWGEQVWPRPHTSLHLWPAAAISDQSRSPTAEWWSPFCQLQLPYAVHGCSRTTTPLLPPPQLELGEGCCVLRAESEICHYLPSTSSPGSCKPLKVSRVPKWLQHH